MIASPARCLVVAALLVLVHGAPPARAQEESDDPLAIKVEPVTLPAGGTAEAIVTITLASGYGILAAPPPTPWTTAASLAVVSSGGVVARAATFPPPKKSRDEDGGKEVSQWTGTFAVRVPLEAAVKAAPGERSLHGRLRYQLRFMESYYKVAIRDIDIPVKVVAAKKGSGGTGAPATRP